MNLTIDYNDKINVLSDIDSDVISYHTFIGRRKVQEDRIWNKSNFLNNLVSDSSLVILADGHGGNLAADYCVSPKVVKKLISLFKEAIYELTKENSNQRNVETFANLTGMFPNFNEKARSTFLEFDEQFLKLDDKSGTTLTISAVIANKLIILNLGDTRSVLGYSFDNQKISCLRVSRDHNPDNKEEAIRLSNSGAKIISLQHVKRILQPSSDGNKSFALTVSRSIGDKNYKIDEIIIADPFINILQIIPDCFKFVITATDGIWNVISDKEAVEIVFNCLNNNNQKDTARILSEIAYHRNSEDNISCSIQFF